MDWGVFWSVLVTLFIIIPLIMIWCFAIVDLFTRQDLSGIAKVAWFFFILLLPILGTVIYYLVRPATLATSTDVAQTEYITEKLTQLSALRESGAISPEEYSQQRARLLGA